MDRGGDGDGYLRPNQFLDHLTVIISSRPVKIDHFKEDEVRICLDPYFLNKAVKREHYSIPLVDEVLTVLQ